jgi:hypothetical protein
MPHSQGEAIRLLSRVPVSKEPAELRLCGKMWSWWMSRRCPLGGHSHGSARWNPLPSCLTPPSTWDLPPVLGHAESSIP